MRIEDTDENRFVPEAESYIIEALKWCGICPDIPSTGVYRQSEHKEQYAQYAHELVKNGFAYYAFDTPAELEEKRLAYTANKMVFKYDHISRETMRNSLTLSEEQVQLLLDANAPVIIRAKLPRNEEIKFFDRVRKWVSVNTNSLDDKVLLKESGMPTYHLANIVDDHLMEITHVIRGEEWLPSTPLHVFLYKSFGWELPEFVHLPLVMGPKGKLSKRDGDTYGFPVYPLKWTDAETGETARGYREDGFLPEAVLNIIALLGWSPGKDKEVLSLDEMVELFDLDHINNSGAKFDLTKATWLNREHMRLSSNEYLAEFVKKDLNERVPYHNCTDDYINRAVGLLKERTTLVTNLFEEGSYLFCDYYTLELFHANTTPNKNEFVQHFLTQLDESGELNPHPLQSPLWHPWQDVAFNKAYTKANIHPREAGIILRAVLCGNKVGPSIFDIISLFGLNETKKRLLRALETKIK